MIGASTETARPNSAGIEVGDRIVTIDGEPIGNSVTCSRSWSPRGQTVVIEYVRNTANGTRPTTTIGEVARKRGEDRAGCSASACRRPADYVYLRNYSVDSIGVRRAVHQDLGRQRCLRCACWAAWSPATCRSRTSAARSTSRSSPAIRRERGLALLPGFLALVSISLGVLNLLPIPVLDGGQIVYQTRGIAEGQSRCRSVRRFIGQQVGIVALLLLMSFAFYNDIARILG